MQDSEYAGADAIFVGGFVGLIDGLAKGLNIRCSMSLHGLAWACRGLHELAGACRGLQGLIDGLDQGLSIRCGKAVA